MFKFYILEWGNKRLFTIIYNYLQLAAAWENVRLTMITNLIHLMI
jgi:hypothetical protein